MSKEFDIYKKKNSFTVIDNGIFKNKEMSLKAKGLLCLMLSLPSEWDYSINGLVKLSKDGRDSVNSALKELEQFGYLIREQKQTETGQFSGYKYSVFEEPQEIKKENPKTEKPQTEKPFTENPYTGNPQQLNTNIINNINNKELNNIKEAIIINNNSKEKKESFSENTTKTKTKRFTKPTLEEVEQYCSERKNSIDAQTFIDYYESKGWLVGKTPMKDWKAAIRNWERRKDNNNTNNKSTYVSPYQYNEEF